MIDWLPYAKRTATFPGSGPHLEGDWKVVIHTTEGATLGGAIVTYHHTLNYPHITLDNKDIEQHCSFLIGSTALQNLSGGVQTNRARAIQIEVVGFATKISELPQGTLANLRRVLATLRDEFGITTDVPEFKAYPASYGANNGVRFSNARWNSFHGVCGHQHVPENLHGDPGALDVRSLITVPVPPVTITKGNTVDMDKLTPHLVDVPRLDDNGNGWITLDVPVEKVVSMVKWGPAPQRDDGYENPGWPDFELKLNNTGGKAEISIESDVPNGHVSFTVWVVE